MAGSLKLGNVVPFVGSGASRLADPGGKSPLPDGRGLARELIAEMAGGFPADADRSLAEVSQYYETTVFDRPTLYDYLHGRFHTDQRDVEPGPVATFLADVDTGGRPLFLMTTNYDTQLERAFHAAGRPLCVITQSVRDPQRGPRTITLTLPNGRVTDDDSLEFQWHDEDRFPTGTAFLFKMHGSADEASPPNDNIIITEDDYVDFLVNACGLVSPYFPPSSLTAQYKQRRFLFLGYSLYDWNFRVFLRVLAVRNALSRRAARRHFAVMLDPDPIEAALWDHRNVSVYNGDLKDFCDKMRSSLGGEP
ncbi:SIR2 family NAD-dependent protein deacylase [Cryptosporangium aurantiacum]|uniref:SIR2-like domain-containing protein n=1 Tax=Cryptosporangium aurantiacum TaxID=134849 RepID=A0A1M7RJ70_9ACTN|nr:SIR2 family protein [Cryptosporangium aurantiacum]SHN46230.1 SIR2-like domain-containing protein [Cryptosporangium aurantiacum]